MFKGIEHSALNLVVGLLLGAAIGFERQWRQRLAGLRTNALVALGAATFVMFAARPRRGKPNARRGPGRFRHRVPGRGPHLQGRAECSRAQHGGHALVLGRHWGSQWGRFSRPCPTVLVIGINLLLRPAMTWINQRLPAAAAEVDQAYGVSVVCRGADEAHVRALLLQGLASGEHQYRRQRPSVSDRGATRGQAQ